MRRATLSPYVSLSSLTWRHEDHRHREVVRLESLTYAAWRDMLAAMLAKLHTFSLLGIDALPVVAEVDVSYAALPKTVLVGLPEQAVKESIHRIERAIVNSGFVLPANRVVINLAPADLPKQASSFDLPIALGLLAASGQICAGVAGPIRDRRRAGARRHDATGEGRAVDGDGRQGRRPGARVDRSGHERRRSRGC